MKIEQILYPAPPYSFELSFGYLTPQRPDPIISFDGETVSRILSIRKGADALINLRSRGTVNKPELLVTIEADQLNDDDCKKYLKLVEEIFCLSLDLNVFYDTIKYDPVLHRHCMNNTGLKPVLEPSLFEALTWAIIGQQVNLHFACQVKLGMLKKYAPVKTFNGEKIFKYPDPSDLAELNPQDWRKFKSSVRKAEYIIGLAQQIQNGFDLEELRQQPDVEIIEALIQIRGIGRWTAEYTLIRGFGRFDALPTGDAGLQNGYKTIYRLDRKPSKEELIEKAELWRPYRGLATYYLWWGKRG